MAYSCCFSLRGNLDFLDFQIKFYSIDYWTNFVNLFISGKSRDEYVDIITNFFLISKFWGNLFSISHQEKVDEYLSDLVEKQDRLQPEQTPNQIEKKYKEEIKKRSIKVSNKSDEGWWHSWQSGRFQIQRTLVWI